MKFYKFKSLEHIEYASDIIINEQLYCTDYDKLNAPFEGLFLAIIRSLSFLVAIFVKYGNTYYL